MRICPVGSSSKRIGLVLLAMAAMLPAGAQAQTPNDDLIVPWKRIGPIAVGMSAADLIRALGEPSTITPGTVEVYTWGALTATVTKDKLWTTQVCTFAPRYATAEGIRPGSTESDVIKLLGKPKYARVFNGFWRFSYSDLYWPGMLVSVHLK